MALYPENLADDGIESAALDIFWADRFRLEPGKWDFDRLPNDFWRLYRNDADGGVLITDRETLALEAGKVYLIPARASFRTRCTKPFRQFFIHFDLTGVSAIALRELFPGPTVVPSSPEWEGAVAELGDRLAGVWKRERPTMLWWAKGVVFQALGRSLAALPEERREQYTRRAAALRPLLPALECLLHQPERALPNAHLAALCHLSEDHFIRRFRDAVGKPPNQYLTERRVALAAHRLLYSDDSIETIAAASGFRNRFYFSRVFARETGVTPAAYRREPRT